jgi:sulfur dioxygenase
MAKISERIIFRQVQCSKSNTYSYILADSKTHEAIIIDPVDEYAERDAQLIKEMGLTLKYAVKY